MALDPATALFEMGKMAIEKIWPDPTKRAQELRLLEEIRQRGSLAELDAHVKIMVEQIKVNAVSAGHKSIFVAGPRPFVIWVGGFSLAWSGIVHPLLLWVWAFCGFVGDPPPLIESGVLGTIVGGLLGVAGMRSYDKTKGTQTDKI